MLGKLSRKSNDCLISGSCCCLPVNILTSPALSVMFVLAGAEAAGK